MVRLALRNTPARPSPKVATSVELLDRTGIVAASLPQRRRSELEAGVDLPAAPPVNTPQELPRDMDLRPRSVVIRRRANIWLGAAAGAVLLVVGWLGGGVLGAQADNAAPVEIQQNVAERPVVVPSAPVLVEPTATTSDEVAPTPPDQQVVPHRKAAKTPARSSARPSGGPSGDSFSGSRAPDIAAQVGKGVKNFVGPILAAVAAGMHH